MTNPSVIAMIALIAVFGLTLVIWAVIEVTKTERVRRDTVRHDRRTK